MEQVKRKVIKVGDSSAVVLPPGWLRYIKEQTGQEVSEVMVEVGTTLIEVRAVIDGAVYRKSTSVNNPGWISEIKERLVDQTNGECQECHGFFDTEKLHLHHILPAASGGKDQLINLELLCHRCHLARHRKLNGKAPTKPRAQRAMGERVDITSQYR